MKVYKFAHYDSGNCRAYFKENRKLFCFTPNFGLEFLACTKDGEPSHLERISYTDVFHGIGKRKKMYAPDIFDYFDECNGDREVIEKMKELWGK